MERWHKVVLLTISYFFYLIVGSLIFRALEEGEEENLRIGIRNKLRYFLINNTCVDGAELSFIVNQVVHAYSNGLRFEENNATSFGKHLWDFSNSLFFATTVITTIGYGNMTPSTTGGKLFCIIFALVGIPLTGIFASLMGNHLESHWKNIISKLNKSMSGIKNVQLRKFILALMVALLLYVLIVCVPAAIVNHVEGWGWFLSQYYAVISISTIGFGDYVAGNGSTMTDAARAIYKLALVIYFVFGFVILTMLFKVSQQVHEKQVRKVKRFTSSVKGRFRERRTSMFPSQSSTRSADTPRKSNGDIGTAKSQRPNSAPSKGRRQSPTFLTNGHVRKPFNLGWVRKNKRNSALSQQVFDLNAVVSEDDTAETASDDDVFTITSTPTTDVVPLDELNNVLKTPISRMASRSFQDISKNDIKDRYRHLSSLIDGHRTL